jgi:CubicO group peptidase (beta-lactamase class C family)
MRLTKIVEVVSHQSFSAFMHDRIFGPLGMAHTEIDDDTTEILPHRATGYARRSDPKVKDDDALGLVWRTRHGHPMLDYSGADIDTSTYMARFPAQRLTVVCQYAAWRCGGSGGCLVGSIARLGQALNRFRDE